MSNQIDILEPRSSARIPALDGIRGLAICLVLSWHALFQSVLPNHPQLTRVLALGRLSWSGVDLFFVLSGFLIGGILLDQAKAQRYFAPFYIRRAHRILPLYTLLVLVVFAMTYACRHLEASGMWVESRIPLPYYLGFLQNFWTAIHADFGSYTLGVTWSLAIEEQFYLTLPLIVRYVSRSRLWWIVAAVIVGAPLLRILLMLRIPSAYSSIAVYVLMPCRADALGWGILAALIMRTPAVWERIVQLRAYVCILFGAVAFIVAAVLLSAFRPFSTALLGLEYSLLAVLYFLLLIIALINPRLKMVLSMKFLRYMGTMAYGLYLLHFPFIATVHDIIARVYQRESGVRSLFVSIAGVGLAVAAAAVSWEYIEKPLVKRGHRYEYDRKSDMIKRPDLTRSEDVEVCIPSS
jgi:peptidoglycan/LPS O-acetylase OafA/YrhL